MKKLIRVFIAVFCLFFSLMAISGSNLPAITPYTQKIPEYMWQQPKEAGQTGFLRRGSCESRERAGFRSVRQQPIPGRQYTDSRESGHGECCRQEHAGKRRERDRIQGTVLLLHKNL